VTAAPGPAPATPPPVAAQASPGPVLAKGTQIGKYKILGILGRGGMGNVYAAEDTLIKRKVAIKLLPPEMAKGKKLMDRLLAEAQSAGALNHANVVTIYDVLRTAGTYAIVMELVPGGSVQDYLQAKGSPGWRAASRLIAEAAKALQAAHEQGLIHRDIKPSNLMLTNDGHVKVSDFGLAKHENKESTLSTQAGTILGTPAFMSPEQCRGEKLDARADIYSLGATYFALLTGKPPFEAPSSIQVMFAHCSAPVPDPRDVGSDVPDDVVAVLHKMLAKTAAERYASAKDLLADLRAVLGGSTSAAAPLGTMDNLAAHVQDLPSAPVMQYATPRAGGASNKWLLIGGGIAVAVLVLLGAMYFLARPVSVATPMSPVAPPPIPMVKSPAVFTPPAQAPDVVAVAPTTAPASDAVAPAVDNKPPAVALVPPTPGQSDAPPRIVPDAPKPDAVVEPKPELKPEPKPDPKPEQIVSSTPAVPPKPVKPREAQITNSIDMKLVWIQPGTFTMGQKGMTDAPPHQVTLSKGYYLQSTEVTQGQFSKILDAPAMRDELPMASATYEAAEEFCRRLNEKAEEKAAGRHYRLPTEAEWEFACRAGTVGKFSTGETLPRDSANYGKNIDLASLKRLESGEGGGPPNGQGGGQAPERPQPPPRPNGPMGPGGQGPGGRPMRGGNGPNGPGGNIPDRNQQQSNPADERAKRPLEPSGSFPANHWGLYDMHGSVWEWCSDFYDANYYKTSPETDPTGPETGKNHVLRGGAWNSQPDQCQSAYRNGRGMGETKMPLFGFRVVCEVSQ
jgi:serine/threonine protein kinase/formylglycine-generating enzyme required for sulfatase activity